MAITAYGKLFKKLSAQRLCHPELYTCYGNRAGAYQRLGLFDEALLDAERCRSLAQEAFKKCALLPSPYRALKPRDWPRLSASVPGTVPWDHTPTKTLF